MKLSVAFSGAAGTGINTAGILLWEYLVQRWLNVLWDKEYASIIKWDNNLFVNYISDTQIPTISKEIDVFFALDKYGIKKNQKIYKLNQTIEVPKQKDLFQNTIALGMAFKYLGLPLEDLIQIFEKRFEWEILQKNIASAKFGYDALEKNEINLKKLLKESNPNIKFLTGNYMIAQWAMDSGLEFYSAYPMTPASSLINYITQNPKVTFFQWEDEIAVSMAMLGAKFAGKRAMCGTSWWGFALMSESISYSNQAEIWWVWVLAQRAWPSTWTPTFTEQWDILFALNASFGDTKPIVLAPSDYEEGYTFIGKALNWSDIYQHPVVFLEDKQFAESYLPINTEKLKPEPVNRGKLEMNPSEDFLRYKLTDDGISPYTIPGTPNWEFIAPSYEHEESGATSEDPEIKKQQTDKRWQKIQTFINQEFNEGFWGFEIINEKADKFFVSFGFNKKVIQAFLQDNSDRWAIIVKVLQPLDPRLKQWLDDNEKHIKKLVFVEMNYSGQFEYHLSSHLNLNCEPWKQKISSIRRYQSYPIFIEDILADLNISHEN